MEQDFTGMCCKAARAKRFFSSGTTRPGKTTAYLYMLTPRGIEEKAMVTGRFLKRKMAEYDRLKKEIEELHREANEITISSPGELK